jgi:hypothetical protein
MLELPGLIVVNKLDIGQRISDMQASSHGWITPTTSTTNNTMDALQQFVFLSPSQDTDEEDELVTEMNGVISPPKV